MIVGLASAAVGASIGTLVAIFGYVPRVESLVMIPAGAMTGGVAGCILGLLLCYSLFARNLTNRVFYGLALVAAIVGVLSAVVFRFLTRGEGAWLAQYPTILATVISAIWLRLRRSPKTAE
jgi:hypothetical protein